MPFYLTPITVALITIALLLIFAAMPSTRALRHWLFLRNRWVLLELPVSFTAQIKINDFLSGLRMPFILEIAVHNLGKDVHYYLLVPGFYSEEIKERTGAKEVIYDYDVYHPGGSHLGFYLKSPELFSPDLSHIDFSRLNEIGEGALVQFVVRKAKGQSRAANFRVLVSAPTQYQAQEIALGINSSLADFKPVAVNKNLRDFMHKVNYREFDEEAAVAWKIA